jgi:hypothetical protein
MNPNALNTVFRLCLFKQKVPGQQNFQINDVFLTVFSLIAALILLSHHKSIFE